MPSRRLARLLASLPLTLAAAPACGDDASGSGPTTSNPACVLVGDPIALEASRRFDVAATDAGFELVIAEAAGAASYAVTDAGLGPRRALPLPSSGGDLRLAAAGADRVATSVFNATFDGLPIATSTGGDWIVARDVASAQGATFTYGSSIAPRPGGGATIVWLGASGLDAKLLYATWTGSGFGDFGAIDTGVASLGNDVAAAYDKAQNLVIAFTGGDPAGAPGLYAAVRTAGGQVTPALRLGAAEGGAQGMTLSGLAVAGGVPWAVVVEPSDFMSGAAGGVRAYRLDTAAGVRVSAARVGPRDDRPVVAGVSVAALGDGRVVVSASWGENDLDAAASDDEVLLYACDAASCRQALVVDGARGTFFGPARIAASGEDGVIVYEAEPKRDAGPERTVLRRFHCDAAGE